MEKERNVFQKLFQPETARGKVWRVFVLIIFLTIGGMLISGSGYYNQYVDKLSQKTNNLIQLPKTKEIPFILGLDLQGGTHLVYKTDISRVPEGKELDAVEGVRDVIERRVNIFGVSEPNVTTMTTKEGEHRIIADLAGVSNIKEAIEMIGKTPLLEFKELQGSKVELTDKESGELEEYNKKAEILAEDVLGKALSSADFTILEEEYDESGSKESYWINKGTNKDIVEKIKDLSDNEIYPEIINTDNGLAIVQLNSSRVKTNQFTEENIKEVEASHILICHNEIEGCENDISKDDAYTRIKEIKEEATLSNFEQLAKENSTEPGADVNGGYLGWFESGRMVKPFEDTVFPQDINTISYIVETQFGYHLIYKKGEREIKEYEINDVVILTKKESDYAKEQADWKNTELSGKHLKNANLQWDRVGVPQVGLQFNEEGSELFEEITARNIDNKVGIFLDGLVISAPNVNEKISGGEAVINGGFGLDEAKKLVQRLNQGALPVPVELIGQKTVGATLGAQSVKDSLNAGLIGLALVAVFMILIYRVNGIFTVISLGIYGVLVLAAFKIFHITLSLAGLAGFILSIGMAVDANVLIFERLKEELKKGKEKSIAIKEAFDRAWPSIRDGNFSTLITCFILMQFSTTLVRGFAITLGIGILISLFASMVVTKNLALLFNKK